MVNVKEKQRCCGCGACVQACPQQCIGFEADAEGFCYPSVDETICIDCVLCEQVCPVLHPYEKHRPIGVLAAINKDDEVRERCSSGGIFSFLANQVIDAGGVVFGVRFNDEWLAVFDCAETREQVTAFRGSKYLQARVGDCYVRCKQFLEAERQVLFSGTPCQIAGLHRFLRKTYENLLTVDFICHGVPSPKVWERYLEEEVATDHDFISSINFRDKRQGWKQYMTSIGYEKDGMRRIKLLPNSNNYYMKAFLANLTLRPSCYVCSAKSGKSHSDITLGDFWGIDRVNAEMDDNGGTSVVMIHTEKGLSAIRRDMLRWASSTYEDVVRHNPSVETSAKCHPKREQFFAALDGSSNLTALTARCLRPPLKSLIKGQIKRILQELYLYKKK